MGSRLIRSAISNDAVAPWHRRLLRDTRGQDLVEYAMLAGFVSLVCVLAVTGVGASVGVVLQSISNQIEQ